MYKINDVRLDNILQFSEKDILDNEKYINIVPSNMLKQSYTSLSFAQYIPKFHPFIFDTKVERYYQPKDAKSPTDGSFAVNFGASAKYYAPTLYNSVNATNIIENLFNYALPRGTYDFYYKSYNPNSTFPSMGELVIKYLSSSTEIQNLPNYYANMIIKTMDVPQTFILAIQGAGGGGAGGGEGDAWWNTKKFSAGGGAGGLAILNVEVPYKYAESTRFMRIVIGRGGDGGSQSQSGGQGGVSTLYLAEGNTLYSSYIVQCPGGRGGICVNKSEYKNAIKNSANRTQYAVDKIIIPNGSYYSLGQGKGRVAINQSVMDYNPQGVQCNGIPGLWYSLDKINSYFQYNYSENAGPIVTSNSNITSMYNTISLRYTTNYIQSYGSSSDDNNHWQSGISSRFSGGGRANPYQSGVPGGRGYRGSGGGAGSPAGGLFNSHWQPGGAGGDGDWVIYW